MRIGYSNIKRTSSFLRTSFYPFNRPCRCNSILINSMKTPTTGAGLKINISRLSLRDFKPWFLEEVSLGLLLQSLTLDFFHLRHKSLLAHLTLPDQDSPSRQYPPMDLADIAYPDQLTIQTKLPCTGNEVGVRWPNQSQVLCRMNKKREPLRVLLATNSNK
jgi:hypothetical protein